MERHDRLPTVSLVTPSFNQGAFLERAIRSVLVQRPNVLEYFVHDAGSTDGSVDIIRSHADAITAWRSRPDAGQSAAINEAWHVARGEVVGWLNSDDELLPGAVANIRRAFASHPDAPFVYGRLEFVDPHGTPLGISGEPWRRRTMILSRSVVPQPAAFVRRSALERVGLLDERLHYVMDFELYLRLAELGPPAFMPEVLARATVHRGAKTSRGRDSMAQERQIVRRRYARGPERLLVELQPVASHIYRAMPRGARAAVDRARPRRPRADRPS